MTLNRGRPHRRRSKWDKQVTPKLCAMPGCERHQFQDSLCRRHLNPAKAITDPASFFDMSAQEQREARQEAN